MSGTKYSYQVDLGDVNTSHSLAVLSVPPGSRVLDLGAADGSVDRALVKRGCRVWAVEMDPNAAALAAGVCEQVTVADLETDAPWQELQGQTFDAVLALDVLEHLRNPTEVVRRAAERLTPNGIFIVSLPNVAHAAVRLSLLQGHFHYTDIGLLDRTHLRFFDRAHAEQLLTDAGLLIVERLRVSRGVGDTEVALDLGTLDPELVRQITNAPDALTYQFVFVARQRRPSGVALAGDTLAERLQSEVDALRARFAEVEGYAHNLKAQCDALTACLDEERHRTRTDLAAVERQASDNAGRMEMLAGELDVRMRELQQRHTELRHAKSEIAVKQAFIDKLREELDDQTATAKAREDEAAQLRKEVQALHAYASSAGFRLVERTIAGLKRMPFVYRPARAMVRMFSSRPTR